MATKTKTIVLAYSGGLDTSVAIKWLADRYDSEIVTVTADLGNNSDLPTVKERAIATGARKAQIIDGKSTFIENFIWPALKASALYEGVYPLATALARPLIAKFLVEAAKEVKLSVPIVVRLAGTNVEQGKKILQDSKLKIISADNLDDAAKKIVETTK